MPEIEIDGRTYVVEGDYPNGNYAMHQKSPSPQPETSIQIARKILQAGDLQELGTTAIGRALKAILKILIEV